MARPPWVKSRKNDRVFSSLRKRKNFEIFSTCSDDEDIGGSSGACREAGLQSRPWAKSRKNDKVFSSLRKQKNLEKFLTCSDGGDIGGSGRACREAGKAALPWGMRSRRARPGGPTRRSEIFGGRLVGFSSSTHRSHQKPLHVLIGSPSTIYEGGALARTGGGGATRMQNARLAYPHGRRRQQFSPASV